MPRRSTLVTVSEPTMHDGIWTLAQFRWRALSRFTDQDIEAAGANALTVMLTREMDDLKGRLHDWLRDLPEVDEWCERLHQSWRHDTAIDNYCLRATASGWFSLSDDEGKTEHMLKLVDCETVLGIPARLVDARPLPAMTAHELLLQPGTANNDINPDFTAEWFIYNTTERFIMPMHDYRRVWGTPGNPVDERLPDELSEPTLPDTTSSDGGGT